MGISPVSKRANHQSRLSVTTFPHLAHCLRGANGAGSYSTGEETPSGDPRFVPAMLAKTVSFGSLVANGTNQEAPSWRTGVACIRRSRQMLLRASAGRTEVPGDVKRRSR